MILKRIPHFPEYCVSCDGKRVVRERDCRVLQQNVANNGYYMVSLFPDGKHKRVTVHSLVSSAFIGERPSGCVVRHLDGNKLNNHVDNLAYGTYAENSADAVRHGVTTRGSRNSQSKLTQDEAAIVKRMILDGVKQKDIAERFNISRQAIYQIQCGNNWAWVEPASVV